MIQRLKPALKPQLPAPNFVFINHDSIAQLPGAAFHKIR